MSHHPQVNHFEKPDLRDVLEREGIELKQRGRDLWASCPFHEDRTPSFKVNPELQKFYCFGCGRRGDVIDFIMAFYKTNFEGAIKRLGMKGIKGPDPDKRRERELVRKFQKWVSRYYDELTEEYRVYKRLTERLRYEEEAAIRAWIFHELPLIEHRMEILLNGDDEDRFLLWKEVTGGKF